MEVITGHQGMRRVPAGWNRHGIHNLRRRRRARGKLMAKKARAGHLASLARIAHQARVREANKARMEAERRSLRGKVKSVLGAVRGIFRRKV